MKSPRPVSATINVDRMTTSVNLSEFAQFEHELDGSQPFVCVIRIETSCAPVDVLPASAHIERCITTESSVTVLARMADATLHLQAFPRATTVHISAVTHNRAEEIADQFRRSAPTPPSGTTPVRVWHHTCDRAPASADRNIDAPRWQDIAINYPAVARESIDALAELVRPVGTGKLILWHGPPGTGKTTALRALMRKWASWCQPQYIADPEVFFAEPGYMTHVLTTAPVARVGPTLTRAGQPEALWRLVVHDGDVVLKAVGEGGHG